MNTLRIQFKAAMSVAVLAAWATISVAHAQTAASTAVWPSRPVRIVVPYAPGGGVDLIARQMGERLQVRWRQPVVVENRPGASTIIGATLVAKAAPDGHTLMLTSEATITSNPFLFANLQYDPERDFTPISRIASLPQMVVIHAGAGPKLWTELHQQARSPSSKFNYASYGSGSLPHLLFEGLARQAGVPLTQVPYAGIAPAVQAVVSGEVQLTLAGVPASLPHIQAGRLHALAISHSKRLAALPDVPTLTELGLEASDPGESWFGLFAPAATPAELIRSIHADLAELGQDAAFLAKVFTGRGYEPVFSSPDALRLFIAQDRQRKSVLIRAAGVKAE
jgi:tripartite-type tricarboxylate transporter receptor subunit TctC